MTASGIHVMNSCDIFFFESAFFRLYFLTFCLISHTDCCGLKNQEARLTILSSYWWDFILLLLLIIFRAVYEELGKYGDVENQVLCRERVEELEPSIRYCLHKIGESNVKTSELLQIGEMEGPALDLFKSKLEVSLNTVNRTSHMLRWVLMLSFSCCRLLWQRQGLNRLHPWLSFTGLAIDFQYPMQRLGSPF